MEGTNMRDLGIYSKLNSVRSKLLILVLSIFMIIFFFMIGNNMYAINVVRNQVYLSNRNTISLHIRMIDFMFTNIDRYLAGLSKYDADIGMIEHGIDNDSIQLAEQDMVNDFKESTFTYTYIDSIFMYTPSRNVYIDNVTSSYEYGQKSLIRDYLKAYLNKTSNVDTENWFPIEINNKYYFFRIVKLNSTYFGTWVSTDRLLSPLETPQFGKLDYIMFVTSNGKPLMGISDDFAEQLNLGGDLKNYYYAGKKDRYMVVGVPSTKGNFSLIALISEKNVLEGLGIIRIIINYLPFGLLVLIPLFLAMLTKIIITPINRIVNALNLFKKGDLDVQIAERKVSNEFRIVNESFNSMTSEIKQLKIDVYEQKLMKQKAELQYYQLQIKPHFLINCLNMINNLAQIGNLKLIQDLTLYLGKYFRYGLKNNSDMILLEEEQQHIENYVKIQQMRYPGRLKVVMDINQSLLKETIPPLLIQTFVENSMKYALNMDSAIQISVEAHILPSDNGLMEILISDTGPGYTRETLETLEKGERIIGKDREHIGILCIKKQKEDSYFQIEQLVEQCNQLVDEAKKYLQLELLCYIGDYVLPENLSKQLAELKSFEKDDVSHQNNVVVTKRTIKLPAKYVRPEMYTWSMLLKEEREEDLCQSVKNYLDSLVESSNLDSVILKQFQQDFLHMAYTVLERRGVPPKDCDFTQNFAEDLYSDATSSLEVMMEFVRSVIKRVVRSYLKSDSQPLKVVDKVRSFIADNIYNDLERDKIDNYVNLNPEYLSRLFKKETGYSLMEYIHNEKMRVAKELLADTKLQVSEMASKLGYYNFAYFSQLFKAYTGFTPGLYRKMTTKSQIKVIS